MASREEPTVKTDIIPMTSTRILSPFGLGFAYEVIGTSRACVVVKEKVYRHMGGGIQWVLYVDGKRYRSFETKRAALQRCQTDVTL
jgi:hypothetical protein